MLICSIAYTGYDMDSRRKWLCPKKEILQCMVPWMNLKDVILSKQSKPQNKFCYCDYNTYHSQLSTLEKIVE